MLKLGENILFPLIRILQAGFNFLHHKQKRRKAKLGAQDDRACEGAGAGGIE
jgi:hypothetical protein